MLNIADLRAFYGDVEVLHGVDLSMGEGECVALLGPNGAGKSTLLKAISGVVRWTGSISYHGRQLNKVRYVNVVRRGVVHVPEGREVFPGLSVIDNLRLGAYLYHSKREDVKAELESVFSLFPRLKERSNQAAGTLSGGEQQMLALGRGMMSRPKLLLLDEPSLGLAPIITQEIVKVIGELSQSGISILLVEQNAHVALSITQRAYILRSGKIVYAGPSEDLRLSNEKLLEGYFRQEQVRSS
ncbi:MAG: ABC transporter ATP-binding protein [Clostridia bacterium]|nr:MAG: ABC transporter ATP-binding protein [Clostridia bacterium]